MDKVLVNIAHACPIAFPAAALVMVPGYDVATLSGYKLDVDTCLFILRAAVLPSMNC